MKCEIIKKIPIEPTEEGTYIDELSSCQVMVYYANELGKYRNMNIIHIQDLKMANLRKKIFITEKAKKLLLENSKKITKHLHEHDEIRLFERKPEVLFNFKELNDAIKDLEGWT